MSEAGSQQQPRSQQPGSGLEPIWLGMGSPKPQPRVKQNSMFGHVVDAFDEKSIVKIGEVTPYEKRKRAAEEAAAAAALKQAREEEQLERERKEIELSRSQLDSALPRQTSSELTQSTADVCNGPGTLKNNANQPAENILDVNAQSHILISGGKVVNDDLSINADVYIADGRIVLVGSNLTVPEGVRVIDARDRLVIPGGVDSCTRFQAKFNGISSVDDFCVGTKAALSGGTTTVVDCVVPKRGQSLLEAFDEQVSVAKSAVCCGFAFKVEVSSWSDEVAKEMTVLAKEKGVNSFVFSLSDDHSLYLALKHCRQLEALAFIHAENESFIELKAAELIQEGITGPEGHLLSHSEDVEASTVYRAITLGNQVNSPICITKITGKMVADVISRSRKQGKVVFGESLGASLAVNGEQYYNKCWRHAAAYVTSPPLRPSVDTAACLTDRLANGDTHFVGSDHCTFSAAQKAIGKDDFRCIPGGLNGVAERMSVIWHSAVASGKMDPCRFVAVTSTNAAKIYNLYPKKGRIAAGSDADVVVWDPSGEYLATAKAQFSLCDFNVFEGMTFMGKPTHVISGGYVVFDADGLHAAEGSGQFLPTPCSNEFVYSRIWNRDKMEKPHAVERDANDIPMMNVGCPVNGSNRLPSGEFYSRPPTRSGGRNMQDSSFSLSAMTDCLPNDEDITKSGKKGCGTRINQPPGGKTTTSLW